MTHSKTKRSYSRHLFSPLLVAVAVAAAVLIAPRAGPAEAVGTPPAGCSSITSGLVSWWPMDEIAGGLTPDIIGTNDGALVNGPAPVVGKVGNALSFDGVDDYVSVPHDPKLDAEADFTVKLWFKAIPGQDFFTIIDKSHRSIQAPPLQSSWFIQASGSGADLIGFGVGDGTGHPSGITTNSILDDTWHHVVGVFDGSSVKLYLDGTPEDLPSSPVRLFQIRDL